MCFCVLSVFGACDETIVLAEGSSVDILCTPSEESSVSIILWTLNDGRTPFNQTDYPCNETGSGQDFESLGPELCIAYSNLHIVNVQQDTHEGTYKCISSSDANSSDSTIITSIILKVQG